jgi:hypothetical protein
MKQNPYTGLSLLCLILSACNQPSTSNEREVSLESIAPTEVIDEKRTDELTTSPVNSFTRLPVHSNVSIPPSLLAYDYLEKETKPLICELSNQQDTVIITADGTRLEIPEGAFEYADHSLPQGKVNFEVTTYTDDFSILKKGLSTTSNGRLLETGGMLYCAASCDGRGLQLRKNMMVRIPTQQLKENMELFYGDVGEDGSVNWIPAGQPVEGPVSETQDALPAKRRVASAALARDTSSEFKVMSSVSSVTSVRLHITNKHFESDRPSQWSKSVFNALRAADKQLWEDDIFCTQVKVSMRLLENARYELQILPADIPLIDSIVRMATRDYWDKNKFPEVDSDHQIRYTADYFLRMFKKGFDLSGEVKSKFSKSAMVMKSKRDEQMVLSYAMSLNRLGWINCDRFYNNPEPPVNIIVELPKNFNGRVQLMVDDFRSFLNGNVGKSTAEFASVPRGTKYTLLVFHKDNEDRLVVSETRHIADGTVVSAFRFKPVTLAQLEETIALR